jgi:iron complex outermembrane recepter protein
MLRISILLFLFLCQFSFSQEINKKDTLKYELNQITVTATRFPEKIMQVPYAVSYISGIELQNVKGYGLDEVLSQVPGVLAQSRYGGQDVRISIRGFGARGSGDRSNAGTSRGIRIMIDGFPETEPDGRTSFDMVDLNAAQNIEILRSNASALWGNASGGIINISTVPSSDYQGIGIKGMFGSFGFQKYGLSFSSNIGNGKVFGSINSSISDGWRVHSAAKRTVIDLGIISQMAPQTQLGIFLLGASNIFHIPGPLTQAQFDSNPQQANATYFSRDERRYNRLGRIGASIDHQIDESNEVSGMAFVSTKYLQRSERGTYRDFTRYHVGGNFIYRNLLTLTENLFNRFAAGVDEAYQDGSISFFSLSSTNGRGSTLNDHKREGANNLGAFLQDELKIGEKVTILLGGRYDNIGYYNEDFLDPSFGVGEKHFERFTPKAGITYMFSPSHSIYANLGGGVEAPAGNETDPASTYGQDTVYLLNPLLSPIVSTTLEAGTKQVFFLSNPELLQSFSYDIAFYYINIKNDIVPYRGGRFYFTAGKTNRMGIEFGSSINFDYGFTLKGALTMSDNKYIDYTVDSAHYGKPGKFADYKDNKVAGTPGMFYNVSLTCAPSVAKGFYLTLDLNGIGKYFADDANKIEVPAFGIINISAGLNKPLKITENFAVSGFITVNNVTDKKYVGSAFINPDIVGGVPVYLEPGMPRNITASLSFNF